MCYFNSYTTLKKTKPKDLDYLSRLLRSNVYCSDTSMDGGAPRGCRDPLGFVYD